MTYTFTNEKSSDLNQTTIRGFKNERQFFSKRISFDDYKIDRNSFLQFIEDFQNDMKSKYTLNALDGHDSFSYDSKEFTICTSLFDSHLEINFILTEDERRSLVDVLRKILD